jgi:hypothetical protein
MASAIQRGRAILHGIRNNGTAIDIGYDAFIDTAKVNHEWDEDKTKDNEGFTANMSATDARKMTDITMVPNGATRADAEAAAVFLEPLEVIPFSGFAVEALNGNWIYKGSAIELSTKAGKMSLKFERYDDEDQMTTLSTTVE